MKILFITLLLFTSCTVKHKIENSTQRVQVDPITLGPDLENADKICNERFGKGSQESNDCFLDIIGFFQFDKDALTYCSDTYSTEKEIKKCEKRLSDLI